MAATVSASVSASEPPAAATPTTASGRGGGPGSTTGRLAATRGRNSAVQAGEGCSGLRWRCTGTSDNPVGRRTSCPPRWRSCTGGSWTSARASRRSVADPAGSSSSPSVSAHRSEPIHGQCARQRSGVGVGTVATAGLPRGPGTERGGNGPGPLPGSTDEHGSIASTPRGDRREPSARRPGGR